MRRGLPALKNLFRSVLLLSALTAASAQAAEKIDLIIDTDPGADVWWLCCLPWPRLRN